MNFEFAEMEGRWQKVPPGMLARCQIGFKGPLNEPLANVVLTDMAVKAVVCNVGAPSLEPL